MDQCNIYKGQLLRLQMHTFFDLVVWLSGIYPTDKLLGSKPKRYKLMCCSIICNSQRSEVISVFINTLQYFNPYEISSPEKEWGGLSCIDMNHFPRHIHIYTHTHISVFSHSVMSKLFVTPWTRAHQAPLSMAFSMQEHWSGLPCPSPGDLPNPGIEARSPTLRWMLYCLRHQGSLHSYMLLPKISLDEENYIVWRLGKRLFIIQIRLGYI